MKMENRQGTHSPALAGLFLLALCPKLGPTGKPGWRALERMRLTLRCEKAEQPKHLLHGCTDLSSCERSAAGWGRDTSAQR